MGLANRVVDDGHALQAATELAQQLATLPQTCLRNDRRSAYEQFGMGFDEALAHEFALGQQTLASGEASRGARLFESGAGRSGQGIEQDGLQGRCFSITALTASDSAKPAP